MQVGRIKAVVPGIWSDDVGGTPYWCQPAGWPGGKGQQRGSVYPMEVTDPVIIFFLHGNVNSGAIYFAGPPGMATGESQAPTLMSQGTHSQAVKHTTLHEDDTFIVSISHDATTPIKAIRMLEKRTGSQIIMNAVDGTSKKAVTIAIQAETQLQLYAKGMVDIEAPIVQINGRLVIGKGTI